jgi:hypothetical protein
MATNYYARVPYKQNHELLNEFIKACSKKADDEDYNPFVCGGLRVEVLSRMEVGSTRGDDLHIGKSSGGWVFALHVIPELGLNDLDSWKYFLGKPGMKIFERGDGKPRQEIPLDELLKVITERKFECNDNVNHLFHVVNKSEPAANGMVRKKIDNERCVGHEFAVTGDATWDLIAGDFV